MDEMSLMLLLLLLVLLLALTRSSKINNVSSLRVQIQQLNDVPSAFFLPLTFKRSDEWFVLDMFDVMCIKKKRSKGKKTTRKALQCDSITVTLAKTCLKSFWNEKAFPIELQHSTFLFSLLQSTI